jgi:hypothetical protein
VGKHDDHEARTTGDGQVPKGTVIPPAPRDRGGQHSKNGGHRDDEDHDKGKDQDEGDDENQQ